MDVKKEPEDHSPNKIKCMWNDQQPLERKVIKHEEFDLGADSLNDIIWKGDDLNGLVEIEVEKNGLVKKEVDSKLLFNKQDEIYEITDDEDELVGKEEDRGEDSDLPLWFKDSLVVKEEEIKIEPYELPVLDRLRNFHNIKPCVVRLDRINVSKILYRPPVSPEKNMCAKCKKEISPHRANMSIRYCRCKELQKRNMMAKPAKSRIMSSMLGGLNLSCVRCSHKFKSIGLLRSHNCVGSINPNRSKPQPKPASAGEGHSSSWHVPSKFDNLNRPTSSKLTLNTPQTPKDTPSPINTNKTLSNIIKSDLSNISVYVKEEVLRTIIGDRPLVKEENKPIVESKPFILEPVSLKNVKNHLAQIEASSSILTNERIISLSEGSNLSLAVDDMQSVAAVQEWKSSIRCHVCFSEWETEELLSTHMLWHHSEKKTRQARLASYTCDQCGKEYIRRKDLDRHKKTHEKVMPYVCWVCKKGFPKIRSMFKHVKAMHTHMNPFGCTYHDCEEVFKTNRDLRKHINLVHLPTRPIYQCNKPGCNHFSSSVREYRDHIKTPHKPGEPLYHCDILGCKAEFSKISHKREHARRDHTKASVTPHTAEGFIFDPRSQESNDQQSLQAEGSSVLYRPTAPLEILETYADNQEEFILGNDSVTFQAFSRADSPGSIHQMEDCDSGEEESEEVPMEDYVSDNEVEVIFDESAIEDPDDK